MSVKCIGMFQSQRGLSSGSLTIMLIDAAMHESVAAIAACGVSPIVRIPDNQGWMVKRKCQLQNDLKLAVQ